MAFCRTAEFHDRYLLKNVLATIKKWKSCWVENIELSLILSFYFSLCFHVSNWSFCIWNLGTPRWFCRFVKDAWGFKFYFILFCGINRENHLLPFQDIHSYFAVNSLIIQRENMLPSHRGLFFFASIPCFRWWRKCFINFHKYIILLLDNKEGKGVWLSGMLSALKKIANW